MEWDPGNQGRETKEIGNESVDQSFKMIQQ